MAARTGAGAPPKGRGVRQNKHGRAQIIRAGQRWSRQAETIFLDELAASANVRGAAAAAGFSTTALYQRRRRCAGFAAAWAAALDQGYARVEALLLETAAASLSGMAFDGERAMPAMTVAEAMNLLKLHRAAVKGGPAQRYDARAKPVDMEAVRASILRKIAAIERADARRGSSAGE